MRTRRFIGIKILSGLLIITGIVYALKMFGVLPMHHPVCMWKQVHAILGIIVILMTLWHCIDNGKWFVAWMRGKLRNCVPNVLLVKWAAAFSFVSVVVLLLDFIWPSKVYAVAHIITATIWIGLAFKHCKSKSHSKQMPCRNKRRCDRLSNNCHC